MLGAGDGAPFVTKREPTFKAPRWEYSISPGVFARGVGDWRPSSARSNAASFVSGEEPIISIFHSLSWAGGSEVPNRAQDLLELSAVEPRVASPGVANDLRRINDWEDLAAADNLRPIP